jgi:hypothetical protein
LTLPAQLFCELGLAVPGDPPVEPHDNVRHGHVDPVRFRDQGALSDPFDHRVTPAVGPAASSLAIAARLLPEEQVSGS